MVALPGWLRALLRLDSRRESAEARWTEPSSDITRAILADTSAIAPQRTQTVAPSAKAPAMPAPATQPPVAAPSPAAAAEPSLETQPTAPAHEEQAERPTKRRRWHRAA